MRKVTIVGAGFAGLTLAYHLQKRGFETVIFDKQERAGGMINTLLVNGGQVETAANALMADQNVEDLFVDLGVDFADRGAGRKKRYIFWDEPKRWPLSLGTSWLGFKRAIRFMALNDTSMLPDEEETIHDWAVRVMNEEFAERLLAPGLQGIYAGDPRQLSASLIMNSALKNKTVKGYYKGSISPVGGMGSLIEALKDHLEKKDTLFQFETVFKMPDFITTPTVIATSAWGAAEILQNSHPEQSKILKQCESAPIVRVTCFFEPADTDIDGFGCLFPRAEKFHSLGVLFDNCIFPNRSRMRSESWLLGGASHDEITAWSDDQVIESIVADRERLCGSKARPESYHITRWGRAIPQYTIKWERALKSLNVNPPLFLHGNYLGALGLGKILKRSIQLADQIKETYG